MALDQPPMNRAARRAAAHKKGSKVAPLVRAARASQQSQSRNAAPDPAIGTGDPSESDDMADETPAASSPFASIFGGSEDAPPSRARKPSHHRGGSKQQRVWEGLVSYYGFAGMLVMSRNQADGLLIVSRAEKLADAWLEAGKASPEIMRVLEVLTVAGPYTALVMVHAKLAMDLMSNHGTSPLALFARPKGDGAVPSDGQTGRAAPSAPLPYQPVGPFAPTDTAVPPMPPTDEGLKVWPDVGIPADLDVALRQAARESGRPYSELRDQAMLELAQMQMSQNGHVVAPGALGAPVARE